MDIKWGEGVERVWGECAESVGIVWIGCGYIVERVCGEISDRVVKACGEMMRGVCVKSVGRLRGKLGWSVGIVGR